MKKIALFFVLTLTVLHSIHAADFQKDVIKTKQGKELAISFIKHGTLMLSIDGYTIQVDPLTEYADYTKLPKADLILVTHDHSDHLDVKAIDVIKKESSVIIGNKVVIDSLKTGKALANNKSCEVKKGVHVHAVPAYNTTEGRDKFHPKGRDNGYVLTLYGTRIYIAGDTEDIPELSKLKNIDIAFLPINQPYTMTVEQAVKSAKVIAPKILYPYHYGDTKLDGLTEGLKGTSIDVRIRDMQ